MEDEEFKKRVYIPNNLKLRLEIFNGYGKKELLITIISLIITSIFCYMLQKFFNNTNLSLIIGFTIMSIIIMGILKDKYNMCFFTYFKRLISYIFSQKEYSKKNIKRWFCD